MNTRHHTTETALELVDAQGSLLLGHCTSRSLRLTRYADPSLEKDDRNGYLSRVVSATSPANEPQRHEDGINSWKRWLTAIARPEHLLHAKLEARLLINMGGTVLENAGLQLDRFGTAYLPGSAVKACARRTALATLRQWCETLTDGQPTKPTAADDALAPACAHADFKTPSDLLLAILRVFGCTDLEWKRYDYDNNKGNDIAWACANQWDSLSPTARDQLPSDTLRGSVAFLPAYPYSRLPVDLELDVLTSHHPDYYGDKKDTATATDTENPIPVYFPAVTAGAIYTFALLPVGTTSTGSLLLSHARTWLKVGLETFGLGAKTAAGYGYFSDQTPAINTELKNQQTAAQLAAVRTTLAPDAKLLGELKTKKPDQLRGLINGFAADAKFWTNRDETFQITLLQFATQEDRTLFDTEKANPKSKIIAGLRNLAAKFNRTLPA